MQSKVNIVADDMGNVIRQSEKSPEFGHVRLQQDRVTFGNNGWVKKSNVSTLLHGKLEDLKTLGIEKLSSLPGKIVIKEQLTPFTENNADRDLKYAGDTVIICCVDGEPIYRKTFFVSDSTAEDVLVAHNNSAAIKDANGISQKTIKQVNTIKPEEYGFDASEDEDVIDDEKTSNDSDNVLEEDIVEQETFTL